MVDFEIRVQMDDGDINMYIDYSDGRKWLLELTSGFETFISSIAIRCALSNLSNLPRTNCFIIDEGFSVSDTDNMSNFTTLFEYLKQYYDFILIVTHIDSMKDCVDNLIEIVQDENKYSVLRH